MGEPVVRPLKTPERILIRSSSFRGVVTELCPGLRLSSSFWMSSSETGMPEGRPSSIAPTACPWLSPNVVTRISSPREFGEVNRTASSSDINVNGIDQVFASKLLRCNGTLRTVTLE